MATYKSGSGDVEVKINASGMENLLTDEAGEVARDLIGKAAKVERTAKRLCPADTGHLRSSITHEIGADFEGMFAIVGTDVEYAPYVEFGTRNMAAQPYLRPALESIQE